MGENKNRSHGDFFFLSSDSKMALATTSKITGRNLVKTWLPLVSPQRNSSRDAAPNSAPTFVRIGRPKWWHEIGPDIQFRKGYWRYIFPMPLHEGDEDPNHYARYRRTTIPQSRERVNTAEVMMVLVWWWVLFHTITDWGHIVGELKWVDPLDFTDEELGLPKEE